MIKSKIALRLGKSTNLDSICNDLREQLLASVLRPCWTVQLGFVFSGLALASLRKEADAMLCHGIWLVCPINARAELPSLRSAAGRPRSLGRRVRRLKARAERCICAQAPRALFRPLDGPVGQEQICGRDRAHHSWYLGCAVRPILWAAYSVARKISIL